VSFFQQTGALMLGTRFKRLSETFLQEVNSIYKQLDIEFDPAWFPMFYLLNQKKQITVSEVAQHLKVTQSGASQLVRALEKKGFLLCETDGRDRRSKIIRFTPQGKDLQEKIQPVWKAISDQMVQLLEMGESGPQLLNALDEIEVLMQENSLSQNVISDLTENKGEDHE
jgi:DNA-binding MarR family transcriptional regulator